MTYAASISYFLTHEARQMDRDAMLDLFDAWFPARQGDDLVRGLRMGVVILQQESAMRGETLDLRGALARLAKISRYELSDEFVEDFAQYPMGVSTALH